MRKYALPGSRAITRVHVGNYDSLHETYTAMGMWAIGHGLEPTGDSWEVHLDDANNEPDPARRRTAIFMEVA